MDNPTELQIWLLHCRLLVDIYSTLFATPGRYNPTSRFAAAFPPGATLSSEAEEDMVAVEAYLATIPAVITPADVNIDDGEWEFFYDEIVKGVDVTSADAPTLRPYFGRLQAEVSGIAAGLSAQARKVASPLRMDGDDKLTFAQSPLYWIFVIGLLNRKLCLAAEELSEDVGAVDTDSIKDLARYCLEPRMSSFTGNQKKIAGQYTRQAVNGAANAAERVGAFKGRRAGLKSKTGTPWCYLPFSEEYHRQRGWRTDVPGDSVLGLDAGGRLRSPKESSTFGRLRSKYGLPLRCDISGTTTDAMGFSYYMKSKMNHSAGAALHHLLACIMSMCLTGHHSLDEMALAVSLRSKNSSYDPLDPTTFIDVLIGWRDVDVEQDPNAYLSADKRSYYRAKAKDILRVNKGASLPVDNAMWQALCHKVYGN